MLLPHCVENTKPKHPKNGYCHKVYSNQQVCLLATHLFCGREGVALPSCEIPLYSPAGRSHDVTWVQEVQGRLSSRVTAFLSPPTFILTNF